MPPYYPDQYNGPPNQPYYFNYGEYQPNGQTPRQYLPQQPQQPQPRIQANIPPHPSQNYQQPHPQYQYPPGQPQYNNNHHMPVQYYNNQAYNYNNQYQQQYNPPPPPQPPPPVRVIVPPSPNQANQTNQVSPRFAQQQSQPQQSLQYQSAPPLPAPSLPKPNTPQSQPRVLQEQPNMSRQPSNPISKSIPTPAAVPAPEQSILHPSILLTLTDEYIDAARKLEERTEDYHILMSTALGFLQVVLKTCKLTPLRSAQLSLKYAQLLYDETTNLDDAEIVLTKSIDLCERMKYIDLKYAMQLLLAKILFRSKPRAATRDLESIIQDIETYKHTAWEYPFRFQAIFFSLESPGNHNMHDAVVHLEKIQNTADLHSDRAVYAFAAILESLLHLRTPGQDGISHSQQALAKARSLQLNPDVESHPQMTVMMEFIDLMWALNSAVDPKVIDQKRSNLKDALYASIDGKNWFKDEFTWLRINSKSLRGIPTQFGGLIHEADGKHYMAFSWIGKQEFESLGFLLTGTALVPQNYYTHGKAEKFVSEGYKITKGFILADKALLTTRDQALNQRNHILCIYFLADMAFMLANKGTWEKARETTKSIDSHIKKIGDAVPEELRALVDYLNGCIAQGVGDLSQAIKCFQSHALTLRPQQTTQSGSKINKSATNSTLLDLQLLATINTAFIIRVPSHPQHALLDRMLNLLSTHFPKNAAQTDARTPSSAANTASLHPLLTPVHSLLLSTLPNTTILQTKSLLAEALQNARRVNNIQIMSLCLTLMYDRFFRGGVQDAQAVKCAKAGGHHVRTKLGNPLWGVMSGILEAESMELTGDGAESVRVKRESVSKFWEDVPEGVKNAVNERWSS